MYIYICSPPTRAYLFSYYIDCFIARSNICYLLFGKKQCIGEPSPLPPSQSRSPKTLFCFFTIMFCFLFLFKDLIPGINPD